MSSTIRGDDNFDSAGIVDGSAKVWVNFDGTGAVTIRDSFNVTSITDNGTGDYTINFTNAMADANYALSGGANSGGNAVSLVLDGGNGAHTKTTTAVRVSTRGTVGVLDADEVSAVILGDQ